MECTRGKRSWSTSSLKVTSQVNRLLKKTWNASLHLRVECRNWDVMYKLNRTEAAIGVRVQFWSSWNRKDVIALERVQRRFKRMLPGLGLSYRAALLLGVQDAEG